MRGGERFFRRAEADGVSGPPGRRGESPRGGVRGGDLFRDLRGGSSVSLPARSAAARSCAASVRGVPRRDCKGVGVSGWPGNLAGGPSSTSASATAVASSLAESSTASRRSLRCCQTCFRRRTCKASKPSSITYWFAAFVFAPRPPDTLWKRGSLLVLERAAPHNPEVGFAAALTTCVQFHFTGAPRHRRDDNLS